MNIIIYQADMICASVDLHNKSTPPPPLWMIISSYLKVKIVLLSDDSP